MLDVTEQKTFQSQLQRERDFNQKILNTTQSMILVLDTAGLISYANRRCYEIGYQEGELIGHRLVEWVEASHREDFDAALETTATGIKWKTWSCVCGGATGRWGISRSALAR